MRFAGSPQLHEQGMDTPLVWYASYGSNMDESRFMCYIEGGTPTGGSRQYTGCANTTYPLAAVPLELPLPLYFAEESPVWTGGVAFLGHTSDGTATKGKAYLVARDQFEDVTAQEGLVDAIAPVDIDALRKLGRLPIGSGSKRYDEFIYCGELGGNPVVSFTSSAELRPHTRPSPAYLKMIGSGIMSAHGITSHEAATYLASKPGVAGNYVHGELVEIMQPVLTGL